MVKQLNLFRFSCLCWRWAIFPARLQASIFASAELNFCVRNGNRWTLCDKNTNFCPLFTDDLHQHWAIFPTRLQASIFAIAELNFCVRNGNRWTLCNKNTDLRFRVSRPIEKGKRDEFCETETQTFLLNSYVTSRSCGRLTALGSFRRFKPSVY